MGGFFVDIIKSRKFISEILSFIRDAIKFFQRSILARRYKRKSRSVFCKNNVTTQPTFEMSLLQGIFCPEAVSQTL